MLAEVAVADGQIDLRDRSGLSLVEPKPYSEQNVYGTVSNLDRFARMQTLLNLRSGEGANALETPYQVEWGRVVDGKPQPLAHAGDLVFVGEPVYVQVANTGQDKIYVSLFDVGVGGKITLLSTCEPSGIGLKPGQDYVFGHKEGVGLTGVKLVWPAGIPRTRPVTNPCWSSPPTVRRICGRWSRRGCGASRATHVPAAGDDGTDRMGGTRDSACRETSQTPMYATLSAGSTSSSTPTLPLSRTKDPS